MEDSSKQKSRRQIMNEVEAAHLTRSKAKYDRERRKIEGRARAELAQDLRPTQKEFMGDVLHTLARSSYAAVSEALGVTPATLYKWIKKHEEREEEWTRTQEGAVIDFEARERGVGDYPPGREVLVTLDTDAFKYRASDWPGETFTGIYCGRVNGGYEVSFTGVDGEWDMVIVDRHEIAPLDTTEKEG